MSRQSDDLPSKGTFFFHVRVLRIVDGDTLSLEIDGQSRNIRLFGIDTPESDQPYGKEARRNLELIAGNYVSIVVCATDRYRRIVAEVYPAFEDTESLNVQMIRDGFAYYVPDYGQLKGGEQAQREAESNRRGFWAHPGELIKPWEHRRAKRGNPSSGGRQSSGQSLYSTIRTYRRIYRAAAVQKPVASSEPPPVAAAVAKPPPAAVSWQSSKPCYSSARRYRGVKSANSVTLAIDVDTENMI